jgi:DNA-directed RNA polymerase specialized sigma24 family protein
MRSTSREARDAAYAEFVAARQDRLRRLAFALCGDWDRADEILSAALTKLYVAWPRLEREGIEEPFVRRHIVRADIDQSVADTQAPSEAGPLAQALLALPVKQRRAVLLRHWLGLSVEETAEELAISRSAAHSQAERGLATLAESLAREPR